MWKKFFAVDDEDLPNQKRDIDSIMTQMPEGVRFALTAIDQLPGVHGPFGLTPSNPIPVNGPIGESVYIFRLRGKSGKPFYYQRLGSMDSQEFSRKLDVYEVLSTDGLEWAILYFSMYHTRRSTKCPDDFHFVSWKKHMTPFGIAAKLGAFGTSSGPHMDFPFCLPQLTRSNENLLQLGPRIPEIIAQTIEKVLKEVRPSARPYDLTKLCGQLQVVNLA